MCYLITNALLDKFDFKFNNFYIQNGSEHILIEVNAEELILIEGFVYDLILDKKLSISEIKTLLNKAKITQTAFPEHITGQYNIIHIKESKIFIVSDFISMKPLYYHTTDKIFISNNLLALKDYGFEEDSVAIFQSMIPPLYSPLYSRTLLKDVQLLKNGEYLLYDFLSNKTNLLIDGMNMNNNTIEKADILSIITLLQKNASIYHSLSGKIILPISGGVDSRITLSSFKNIDQSFFLLSYGEEKYIDNSIAKEIAAFIGIPHKNISFKNHLFPTSSEFEEMIENGGEFFISAWFSVMRELLSNPNYNNSLILLGDVLDTLRAKNVKSLRSRSGRIKYQIKTFLGSKVKLNPLNIVEFANHQKRIYEKSITELLLKNSTFFTKLNFNKVEFIRQTYLDLDLFIDYIVQKFQPKYQENLEEAFYITTWGARTMSKQANVFKGNYETFVLMASRHVVKNNLKFSPLDRFEDKLTHKMLKQNGFNLYSHFPTSQIPFIAYKRNIYLKYIVWAIRSGVDQFLIRNGRSRLVQHIEWKDYYQNVTNKKLLEDLLKNVHPALKTVPIDIFNKRASGELWPLSETDINTYIYLLKINCLK